MDNKKIIMIDCNSITSYGELPLWNYEVEYFGLKDGMEIIAHEGTDVWEATVHYNPSADIYEQWWVELGNYVNTLTDEEYKWWVAGCRQGEFTGGYSKEIDIAKKLIDFGMEIKDIQKIVNIDKDRLYRMKYLKLIGKFKEKIISDGGMFKRRYVYADLSAHPMLSNCNDKVFCMFLDYVSKAESADSSAWFFCMSDYESTNNMDGFAWNEFEKMSLESAESDSEKEEIKKWWKCHLPVAMSVKGDYTFLAIDLNNNNIVQGYAPNFEDTEVVAENFEELIKMIISGEFTWI